MTDRKRLLLVEDEQIILADLARLLSKQGYEIVGTAQSGPEAIAAAAATQPDLVLMDVQLQGSMDGLEAARQIWQTARVPIVFVSAHTHVLKAALFELPDHFGSITKPFSPSQLRETVESMLHQNKRAES